MVRAIRLGLGDEDQFAGMFSTIIRAVDNPSGPNTTHVASLLIEELEARAKAGEQWAMRVLHRYTLEGVRRDVAARLKEEQANIVIAKTGEAVAVPTRFGVQAVNKDGVSQRGYQLPFWWDLERGRFFKMLHRLRTQRRRLDSEMEAFGEVEHLLVAYPEARTAREAWELAGEPPIISGIAEAV